MLFLRSSLQFVFASAALGLMGACSGALDENLNGSGNSGAEDSGGSGGTGSDAASHGDGSTGGGGSCATNSDCGTGKTAVDAAATSCTTDSDCGGSNLCEFKIADACSAAGVCFTPPPPGPTCAAYSPACTCDNQTINVICTRYPSGYASKPVAHSGTCDAAAADAGKGTFACGNATCSKGQICRIASGGASPTTTSCIAVPAACALKRTCACVKADLKAQLCSETNGDIIVTFQYP